ncbi:unnamed protein product [Paramecium octaurelia]|uniref:Uncharacterized protein n=1 Tax=Paramecium octaurelia TaxID=43137 RepID=A0A8S1TBP4_PAROT|nr:unnamed protein product [Paramecium octaurelia]
MKSCALVCLLVIASCYQVNKSDKCNECNQLKSQIDCEIGKQDQQNCEWVKDSTTKGGKCQKKLTQDNPVTFKSYCELITQQETSCHLIDGCAYIDKKCVIFAGCSAYGYQRTDDCQAVSYQCISDGYSCINFKECKDYPSDICNVSPSLSGRRICKWDFIENICRDYKCSDSDEKLITDDQCDQWLKGCITRGTGCWESPLPPCSSYRGNEKKCDQYIGSDGFCEQGQDEMCQAKLCKNAPLEYYTDSDCRRYQKGCITNGKGCIIGSAKPLCSAYFGDNSSCQRYIGSDGQCEGTQGGTNCRVRRCEDSPNYNTDQLCREYQPQCITNGVGCVQYLDFCSNYKGNIKQCLSYKGRDGNCKGNEKDKENGQQCMLRVCNEAPTNYSTDEECNGYQINCVTTGFGCINRIDRKSCATYEGDSERCLRLVGSDGNCMWVSGNFCTARDCQSAPANQKCNEWKQSCVSSGNECIMKTQCQKTINQTSCEGTEGCFWQSVCTDGSDCSQFKSETVCRFTKAKKVLNGRLESIKCTWTTNGCRELTCDELIGSQYNDDRNCQNEMSTCISDMKNSCINKYDCSKLYGNKQTCFGYLGYCTNIESADDNSPCITRQCQDNVELTTNQECNDFLPGCITNGRVCVKYGTVCSQMQGDQIMCSQFFGYLNGSPQNFTTIQCYNRKNANLLTFCMIKTCAVAEEMENDQQCQEFLNGCVYDGKGGCVDPNQATCESYYGNDLFCEQAIVGQNSKQYCFGTSTKGQCVKRECYHKSVAQKNSDCNLFRQDCLLKNSRCVDQTSVTCQDQSGTEETCPLYYGGIQIYKEWSQVQCIRKVYSQQRQCQDIASPNTPEECTNYKSTCRFSLKGQPCIMANDCTYYQIPDSANTDQKRFQFCTSIKDRMGLYCGWDLGQFCSIRACQQIVNGKISECSSFIQKGKTTGSDFCILAGSSCLAPAMECFAYFVPMNLLTFEEKWNYCILLKNTKGIQCTYNSTFSGICSYQDSCESLINFKDSKQCNDFLGWKGGQCQKAKNSRCYTTAYGCFSYSIPPLQTYTQKLDFCLSLKVMDLSNKSGTPYIPCTYTEGVTCSEIIQCSDIQNPKSHIDCEIYGFQCGYFNNRCYNSVSSCNEVLFTTQLTTDSLKSLFCNSMRIQSPVEQNHCVLNSDKTGCVASSFNECSQIGPFPEFWDQQPANIDTFCLAHTDKSKTIQCIRDFGNKCRAGTCEHIPSPHSQGDCDNHIKGCIFLLGKCITVGIITTSDDCSNVSKVPFSQQVIGLSISEKISYCELFRSKNKSIKCTFDQLNNTQNSCISLQTSCINYRVPMEIVDKYYFCQIKKNVQGFQCKYNGTENYCRDSKCSDAVNPQSQLDCNTMVFQTTCKYLLGTCYNYQNTCSQIPVPKENPIYYCSQIRNQHFPCTYVGGDYCVKLNTCEEINVENVINKLEICNQLQDNSLQSCTYLWGNNCVTQKSCAEYDGNVNNKTGPQQGLEEAQCSLVTSLNNIRCAKDETKFRKCRPYVCEDILLINDCLNDIKGCFYYNQKCIQKKQCSDYQPIGVNSEQQQIWCENVQNISGAFCKWNGTRCSNRSCSDVQYYTDFYCQQYLSNCKTDGTKCIDVSQDCNQIRTTKQLCGNFLETNGIDKCISKEPTQNIGQCDHRTCYDNISAQSDTECNKFMQGCVTRGFGCIPNTEPCTSYRGTKIQCEQFKQLINKEFVYCSGLLTNQSNTKCKVRICSDNTTATSDQECSEYLKGCRTKGVGCIEESASCTQYQGNYDACQKFKGNYGKDFCFSSGVNTSCRKLECSDINGVDNQSCNYRFDSITCIFDGSKCVNYGLQCSQFQGNHISCANFMATDGPCKATVMDDFKISSCTKRVCNDAPNTLKTDIECQLYHPSCYTTGYGCSSIKKCDNIITQTACEENISCSWSHFCNQQYESCDQIKEISQTSCFNSKVTNQICTLTDNSTQCRSQNCEDLPHDISSHSICHQLNPKCTTSGIGCITFGQCSTYRIISICLNAYGERKCIWDYYEKGCRDIKCTDFQGKTEAECEQQLSGCISNGIKCISGDSCDEYDSQDSCIHSKRGPCLWVQNSCINYSRCEDAKLKTFQECQNISKYCTTNGSNCIPITFCALYEKPDSCVYGLDKQCGWNEKCQSFKACSDLRSSDNDICRLYHQDCVSDGSQCIEEAQKCSMYKTSNECLNASKEGPCTWNQTANICQSKVCEDYKYLTHQECYKANNLCTTDGTTCIQQSTCSSYGQSTCYQGTDGPCIFGLPIKGNSTEQSCRIKECQDIHHEQSNQNCLKLIPGKQCVSNGTHCIPKAQCSTYNTLTACQGGGIEGDKATICAFKPKEKNSQIGSCTTFSQCADAEQDEFTCNTNPSCYWNQNTCLDQTCQTFSNGLNCNPVPNFDGTKYTICLFKNGNCETSDPKTISESQACFIKSVYTHTWNSNTNQCEACFQGTTPLNPGATKIAMIISVFLTIFLIV